MTAGERPDTQAELAATLLSLELRLMDPNVRRDRDEVSALLAEEFREFGSSGTIWNKAEILNLLANETGVTLPEVNDVAVQQISPEAMLVTYKTVSTRVAAGSYGKVTLRSSLWANREGKWQVLFHQGTRSPDSSIAT